MTVVNLPWRPTATYDSQCLGEHCLFKNDLADNIERISVTVAPHRKAKQYEEIQHERRAEQKNRYMFSLSRPQACEARRMVTAVGATAMTAFFTTTWYVEYAQCLMRLKGTCGKAAINGDKSAGKAPRSSKY